jgi:preprotein translocase subunit SecA
MLRKLAKIAEFFHRARGRLVELDLASYRRVVARIKHCDLQTEMDQSLHARSLEIAERARNGEPLDHLLVEAFALACEISYRTVGMRPYDVQVMAGIAMHQGKLAQMQTGEGKTLAAVLPAYLNALTGRGVHVLTFNDYLARRDAQWMGPAYRALGLSVGAVQQGMRGDDRRKAYACDVTYVTAKECGFDYLRDQLCNDAEALVHRPFHYAVVDEADSILIDEARVPLVIAGSTTDRQIDPYRAAELVRELVAERDYETDEFARNVHFTESGLDRLESWLDCGDLHKAKNLELLTELNLALHAEVLLRREVDYIVRDGKIELVDEFTGRVAENRRWPDGLQAAVEAKERVPLRMQGAIRGSITLQHFLRLYPKVSGMTATAEAAAEEFHNFYNLTVVVIPPNCPCIRIDHSDRVFTHKSAKHRALIEAITKLKRAGRPVLVGTASVAESEELADTLAKGGIACQVLNARNDEEEAGIVAQAAIPGTVTISTNMAGRGTDIRLGGDPPRYRHQVVASGGLYVIGTNRHESRRIDDQLRGRAGRQADPGESRFFISLEDDLIQRYGIHDIVPPRYRGLRQEKPLEDPAISRSVARSQRIIESQTFEIRRTLWRYASFVEEHRKALCERRRAILMDQEPRSLLATRAQDRWDELCPLVGERVLRRVEKQIRLFHLDQCWAEYLANVAEIRENIYLVVLGNQNPLDEFHKRVGREFAAALKRMEKRAIRTFRTAEITQEGIDLEKSGLAGPSSTWTYLINDNPFGDVLQRLFRGLKRTIAQSTENKKNGM